MFEQGSLAAAVAIDKGLDSPTFPRRQSLLKKRAETNLVNAGSDYAVKALGEIASLPPELRIILPVNSMGCQQDPDSVFLWFHPCCWLKVAVTASNESDPPSITASESIELPISQHTTVGHVLDALVALGFDRPALPQPTHDDEEAKEIWRFVHMEYARLDSESEEEKPGLSLSFQSRSINPSVTCVPMYQLLGLNVEEVVDSLDGRNIWFLVLLRVSTCIEGASQAVEIEAKGDPPYRAMSEASSVSTVFEPATSFGIELRHEKESTPTQKEAAMTVVEPVVEDTQIVQELRKPESPHGIVGLFNLGNTCYFNSALQCLIQTPDLVHYFLTTVFKTPELAVDTIWAKLYESNAPTSLQETFAEKELLMQWCRDLNLSNPLGSKRGGVARTFAAVLKRVWVTKAKAMAQNRLKRSENSSSTLNSNFSSYSNNSMENLSNPFGPKMLKEAVAQFNESFAGFDQQDSQELLQVLLDALYEDLKPNPPSPTPLAISELSLDPACNAEPSPAQTPPTSSPIAKIFQGCMKSYIKCTDCSFVSTKIDPYTLLSVPIANGTDGPCRPPRITTTIISSALHTPGFLKLRVPIESDWTILEFKKYMADRLEYSDKTKSNLKNAVLVYEVHRGKITRIYDDWEVAAQIVPDFESPLDSLNGVVVAEINAKVGWVHIPVYFGINEKLGAIPIWVAVPREFSLGLTLPDFMDFLRPADYRKAFFVKEMNQLGWWLYNRIISFFAKSGLSSFPLYCRKSSAAGLDGEKLMEFLCSDNGTEFLDDIREKFLFNLPSDLPGELVVVERLFNIDIWRGSASATSVSDKDEFLKFGYRNVRRRAVYPPNLLPEITVDPQNHQLIEVLETVFNLDDDYRGTAFEISLEECMVPKMPKARYDHAGSMDGEVLLLLEMEEGIFDLLFGSNFQPRLDDSMFDKISQSDSETTPCYTLDNCLQEFLKEELMSTEDLWYCPECKTRKQIVKKLDLESTPEVLIFHLKRFSSSGGGFRNSASRKIKALVEFPLMGLDVTAFMSPQGQPQKLSPSPPQQSQIYDLYAVSNHIGGLGGGHYTACVKSIENGKWYDMDDDRVTEIAEDSVMTSDAYLLFYKRRCLNEDAAAEKKHLFWETWEDMVRYGELMIARKAVAIEEKEEHAVAGVDCTPAVHSRYVSSNASVYSESGNAVESASLVRGTQRDIEDDVGSSKRAKLSFDIEDTHPSNQTSLSASIMQSGISSPIEQLNHQPDTARNVDAKVVIRVLEANDQVMTESNEAGGSVSPGGSTGKRTRLPSGV